MGGGVKVNLAASKKNEQHLLKIKAVIIMTPISDVGLKMSMWLYCVFFLVFHFLNNAKCRIFVAKQHIRNQQISLST